MKVVYRGPSDFFQPNKGGPTYARDGEPFVLAEERVFAMIDLKHRFDEVAEADVSEPEEPDAAEVLPETHPANGQRRRKTPAETQ